METKKSEPTEPVVDNKRADAKKAWHRGTLILLAGGLVVLTLGFCAGWLSGHETYRSRMADKIEVFGGAGQHGMHKFRGTFDNDVNPTDGTVSTRLTGVVTQVSGDGFVIAGNGTTKTIKTTSSTTYSTDAKSVKTNDTVMVKGTQNGDTFTASAVVVLNR